MVVSFLHAVACPALAPVSNSQADSTKFKPSHWLSHACFILPHLIGVWPCYIELSLLTAGGEEGGDPA